MSNFNAITHKAENNVAYYIKNNRAGLAYLTASEIYNGGVVPTKRKLPCVVVHGADMKQRGGQASGLWEVSLAILVFTQVDKEKQATAHPARVGELIALLRDIGTLKSWVNYPGEGVADNRPEKDFNLYGCLLQTQNMPEVNDHTIMTMLVYKVPCCETDQPQ